MSQALCYYLPSMQPVLSVVEASHTSGFFYYSVLGKNQCIFSAGNRQVQMSSCVTLSTPFLCGDTYRRFYIMIK